MSKKRFLNLVSKAWALLKSCGKIINLINKNYSFDCQFGSIFDFQALGPKFK